MNSVFLVAVGRGADEQFCRSLSLWQMPIVDIGKVSSGMERYPHSQGSAMVEIEGRIEVRGSPL